MAIGGVLRERVCNTRPVVVTNTPREITTYDNNKQGVIIQNKSSSITAYVTFNNGSNAVTNTLQIVPGGSISFDFAISEALYGFTTTPGASANLVVLEVSGFDTYQLLQIKLLELIADRLGARRK